MTRWRFYITALICTLMISCVPSKIKRNFTNCYDEENLGLDTIIHINGLYRTHTERDRYGINAIYKHQIDTLHTYFMFFDDGIYLDFFPPAGQNVDDFINDIIATIKKGEKHSFYRYNYWGCYSIKNDTIVTQNINHVRSLNNYYAGSEKKYKIIDKNTLLFIDSKPLYRTTPMPSIEIERREQKEREFEKVFGRKRVNSDTARFVPLEEIPPSDCWLKKKRWFWCDKEKFRTWKKEKKR